MTILITNNGIYCEMWGDNIKENIVTPLPKNINHYYCNSVVFSEDLTLGGFLNSLSKYKETVENDFTSYMYGLKLQPYYEILNHEPDETTPFTEILLKHSSSINIHQVKGKKLNYVNSWNYMMGVNKTSKPSMTLSISNLHNFKNLPFKLDIFYNLWSIDAFDKDVLLGSNLIHHFSLHDVIATFLTELTYCGYPADEDLSDEDWEKIKSIEQLLKEDLEFTLKNKKTDLQIALSNEEYEKCNLLSQEIEQLQNLIKSKVPTEK